MKPPAGNRGFGNDPLLRVGMIAMAFALVLTLFAVVLTMLLRGVPERVLASESNTTKKVSAAPLTRGEVSVEPWREEARPARPLPATKISKDEANLGSSGGGPKPGFAATPQAEARSRSESPPQSEPLSEPEPQAQAPPRAQPGSQTGQGALLAGESGWARPTPQEIEAANRPRHYELPAGAIMSLTIPAIGIYGAPVFDSVSQMALARGVAHLPDTSLPWSPTPERNVYLAGHRMGFRGTWSRMLFYNLDKLGKGDRVVLRDRAGRTYEYRVIASFLVDPDERWVTGRVRGEDLLTLQTCTPIPTFEKRLIVRAERV